MEKDLVLITGAGGWLGTELTLQLLLQGKKVRAFNKTETESLKKLKTQFEDMLEIVLGDITVSEQIEKAMKDVKEVYHLAAKVHFIPTNKREEEEFYTVNTEATRQLFDYCTKYKVERVIFFSSVSVFEKSENLISENSKKNPDTIYGKSKLEAEKIGKTYFEKYNLPITIIEPVTVYGEGDVGNFAKLEKMAKKGFLISFGKQKNKKTVIYYKDLIRMTIEIAKDKSSIGKNIICGTETIEVNEIYKILEQKEHHNIIHIKIPTWMSILGIKVCCFSILKKIRRKIQALMANNEFDLSGCQKYLRGNFMSFETFELARKEKEKKVLFVATVTGHINAFHIPYLELLKNEGYEVHVASNGNESIEYCDKHYNLSFQRSPFKLKNLKAYKNLKKIINHNEYEIIHCHTPVGGVLTRLAAKKARKKYQTRVIYTAHGFHFYKGAPLLNWIIYYPIEKYLSKFTDCLITINKEDYELAKKKFHAKQTELVHGVGVDENKFNFEMSEEEKNQLRNDLGLDKNDFVFIQVGELNKNKNQIMTIEAMKEVVKERPNTKLLLVGTGNFKDLYKKKIKEDGLEKNILLLGYRNDVPELLKIANCLISTSKREGLPVNILEAQVEKIPVIATNCRGNRDLVLKENLVEICDTKALEDKMIKIVEKKDDSVSEFQSCYYLSTILNVFKEKIYRN